MTRLTIGIDGFNLAMPRGTGVATYGLGLAEAVAALGHAKVGVFGVDVGDRKDERELLFWERVGKERPPETRKQHHRRLRRETFRSFWPAHGYEVPVTDAVEKQGFAERLPRFVLREGGADKHLEARAVRAPHLEGDLVDEALHL